MCKRLLSLGYLGYKIYKKAWRGDSGECKMYSYKTPLNPTHKSLKNYFNKFIKVVKVSLADRLINKRYQENLPDTPLCDARFRKLGWKNFRATEEE